MTRISLTQGKFALVDDSDYVFLSVFKWTYSKRRDGCEYAIRMVTRRGPGPKQINILMHRVILGVSDEVQVDHRDCNGLNNQRYNLRPATRKQNGGNRRKLADAASRFKGVRPSRSRWRADVTISGKIVSLGTFGTEKEAALAYDRYAVKTWGTFARLNYPST